MDIEQLKTFVNVIKLNSFSKTAIYLHISQPTVTSRIKKLEEELEQILILRHSSKNIKLTAAGEYFFKQAKDIIKTSDNAKKTVQEYSSESEFSIGSSLLCSKYLLSDVITSLTTYSNYTPLEIRTVSQPHQLIELFVNEMIDMALLSGSDYSYMQNIELLWNEPTVIVASSKHPATHKKTFKLSDFSKHPLVLLGTDVNHYSHQLKKLCEKEGFEINNKVSTDNINLAMDLVKQKHYISLLPLISVEDKIKTGEFIEIKHNLSIDLSFNIYLLYRFEQGNKFSNKIYGLLKKIALDRIKKLSIEYVE